MPETPVFAKAAVAAPHMLAANAGKAVLTEGGNAIEAMVAMAATIAVVYPHMNGIGGDGFWLIHEPGGKVRYLEAAGFAGSNATIPAYKALGYDAIPLRGAHASLTVPGAIGGWKLALELARAHGGKLPLKDLLADAIAQARDGYPVSASEARYAPKELEALKTAPHFAETFLVDGKQPARGAIRKVEALGKTLQHLADVGLDDFYRGDVAREIAADFADLNGFVTREDLAKYAALERAPLSLRLKDCTVYNSAPPTQGLASLILLGIYETLLAKGFGKDRESFAFHHALIEATKRAFAIRGRVLTDFTRMTDNPADFLNPEALAREASRIALDRAAPFPLPPEDGDTIWMGAIDGNGLAVSYIQSVYWEYGSGCVLPKTGILLQNRGVAFQLDEKAKNPLEPGRRPFHTLNPPLAVFDDGRVMSYGTMGGDGQPQFQAQVFARYARHGMGVADAVDAPRWLLGKTWGASTTSLKYESRFDGDLIAALDKAGHSLEAVGQPYIDGMGHAGALVRHPKGHIEATHDPRSDGGAAGI